MEKGETSDIPWEDRLSARYYRYAMEVKNDFMAAWFELNLNIGNILAAINCRKYDLDRKWFLVGDNEVRCFTSPRHPPRPMNFRHG